MFGIFKMNFIIDEIEEIEDLGVLDMDVYDVGMVDTPHTFFANNLLVHNSLFASAYELVKHFHPDVDVDSDETMSKYILEIVSDVQKYINSSYSVYAEKIHNVSDHKLFIKQELIGKAGFFTAKKRYAIHMINKEGIPVNELEIKGLDVVRSDFPKAFQGIMTEVLWKILKFEPKDDVDTHILKFKESLDKQDIRDIMFSSSIKDIEKYNSAGRSLFEIEKGTPAHVKAALSYNDLLKHLKLFDVERIKSGDKIKWTYLKKNPYELESCGIRFYKDPEFISDLVLKNIDYHKVFESKLAGKLEDFYSALNWENMPQNTKVAEFFSF